MPVIQSISGCGMDVNGTTKLCSTSGAILTITGRDFFSPGGCTPLSVVVEDSPCPLQMGDSLSGVVQCALPPGTGRQIPVVVQNVGSSVPFFIDYSPPSISRLFGC